MLQITQVGTYRQGLNEKIVSARRELQYALSPAVQALLQDARIQVGTITNCKLRYLDGLCKIETNLNHIYTYYTG